MIYKRGQNIWWYEFTHKGERYRGSTHRTNKKKAAAFADDERERLIQIAEGRAPEPSEPIPTLEEFAERFRTFVSSRSTTKKETERFYFEKLRRLLEYRPLAKARLDRIDERLIDEYVACRIKSVSPGSVNREQATLRKLLRQAKRWKLLKQAPEFKMLDGEVNREFVLSEEQERIYLEFAEQPLRDVVTLMVNTGMRTGEAIALRWDDVELEPAGSSEFGYLHVRKGKSRNAKRSIPLTSQVAAMFRNRSVTGDRVFDCSASWVQHQHQALRAKLGFDSQFVLHGLRHTFLTRLGLDGVDAFTIKRIAGHSSITISERYVHSNKASVENAFRLREKKLPTISPTVEPAVEMEAAVSALQ